MSYKVLYRKYRPDSFDNVVGQDYTVKMLKNAICSGKNAHAYIFTGPRGTGKTSSAKIFAKALNCLSPVDGNPCNECDSCKSFKENPDIIEIDAASNNGVDEIRELINNVKLVPSNSKYKVYIIDEVHMLSTSAFNALLLTLEEPPSHVVFILATTDIQNVPITILSRCQRFDFKPISINCLVDRLSYVCKEESISITDDAIKEIALISAGGMRDALGMLDQLSADGNEISLDDVSNYFGSVSSKVINELLTCIEQNNINDFSQILGNIKSSGTNYSVFIEKLIYELRKIAIEIKSSKSKHDFYFEDVYGMIFDLNECLCNININIDPYVLIEISLLKYFDRSNRYSNVSSSSESKSETDSINNVVVEKNVNKPKVINKKVVPFDINIRINNCFVDCSKDIKNDVSNKWSDFLGEIKFNNKNLYSLLVDSDILAASGKYILISSKSSSSNELINFNISNLENEYMKFTGNKVYFCSLDLITWKNVASKYASDLKNGIKYEFKDDVDTLLLVNDDIINVEGTVEDVGKDIFGSFDIK